MNTKPDVLDAAPTLDEVRAWPATVDVPTAGRAYGLTRANAFRLAHCGEFPARVLKIGGRYRVVTASIIATLADDSRTA
jgi:hypothetical protein